MDLNGLFIKEVPFPYFIFNKSMEFKASSLKALEVFPGTDDFIQLIDIQFQEDTIQFLLSEGEIKSIEVPMNEKNQKRFYQIYKAKDPYGSLHLYCLPISTELAELQEMMDRVEQKLKQYNLELADKKEYLEKSVEVLKEAAIKAERRDNIENLAAGIAHEIRNPLTTVKGFIQLLKPYLKEIGKEQYADIALEEINRANSIIFEFLNAAKPEVEARHKRSVNHLVKDIAMLYESEAILRNIHIQTILDVEDINLKIDTNQLKQVLINMIKNSMEAFEESTGTAAERLIVLLTRVTKDIATISIKDNGSGMSPETIKNLFLPFYTTKEKGTGIGLSVCKKIIEENGGTIQVDSLPGTGTIFKLCFPSSLFSKEMSISHEGA
ncbi:ATP-binding protein [Neobacillus terrae]|uniref:ATP-binding protein n=1 Tax=Neobacillus terrae TaxID=3034837 RepID=UPI00140AF9B7|nr:ATP-binding protein [Neobacillus terrae]NHM31006.1 GHKL domain-containing protein [Neobacillus terrae]